MPSFTSSLLRSLREPRTVLFLVMLYCAALLIFALVLVRVADLVPCPLCILQRFFYAFIGLAALVTLMRWWQPFTERVAGGCIILFSLLGGGLAGRQVWMQRFPAGDSDPTKCIVSFGSFIDDVVFALGGTGNCAIIDWSFIGLSIADWSLMAFTLLGLAGVWLVFGGRTRTTAESIQN